MKHTDFNDKLHEIWRQEVDELKEALRIHGGVYEWDKDDDHAIVLASSDDWGGNVEVLKVQIVDDDIELIGIDNFGSEDEYRSDNIAVGHISYVTEFLPEL